MSAPSLVIPLTPAEIARLEAFRALEMQSLRGRVVAAEEMIDIVLSERHRIEASAHAAVGAFGGTYDAGVIRRIAVLGATVGFLRLVDFHRDDVLPILKGSGTAKRVRRG